MQLEPPKPKLFISYSHLDENPYVVDFKKHISPLRDNKLIEDWHDRKIIAGDDWKEKIDNNLEDAHIICLFISANYLASASCKEEKERALELKSKKGISVIPIILSPCGWQDDSDIVKMQALPTDGKAICTFPDANIGWNDVYNGLKKVIERESKMLNISLHPEFSAFLQNSEMLTKAHSQKETVFLDDIFIYPELVEYDEFRENKGTLSAEKLVRNILDYHKVVIAGESQSGKTSLCKIIFSELRRNNYFPIYVHDKEGQFKGILENRISQVIPQQYSDFDLENVDSSRIVLIIDDFHYAKNKDKIIRDLSKYEHCILIVDDIFAINLKDDETVGAFAIFRLKEFKPSLRYELIKKWVALSDKKMGSNDCYKDIDQCVELTNATLGKIIGKGIMPSYPFFILSTLVTYETFAKPLDQEITSQGYCYEILIYFYLRKEGVKNDEIDIYINFLTELAYHLFREKKECLSADAFDSFMSQYLTKYTLPVKPKILLRNIQQIFYEDSLGNMGFKYLYYYYFFVAKYLHVHLEDKEIKDDIIANLMNNLHLDENAYISIFLVHHSRNTNILDEIELNAMLLFSRFQPAQLSKTEIGFFDEQAELIIKAALPAGNITPEIARADRVQQEDMEEDARPKKSDAPSQEDVFEMELRRAIKTVEVIGCVIKNRAGSLEKTKLKEIFKEALEVHLRILSSFFGIIKDEKEQKVIVEMLAERLRYLNKESAEKERHISEEKLEKSARAIFWNVNFMVTFGVIYKIVHTLGSDKLTEIVTAVCDEIGTPASFLIKHGITMWYNKNLKLDEIAERFDDKDFSEIARRAMRLMVVNHCSLHSVGYKEKQKIISSLGIPQNKLMLLRGN